MPWDPKDLEDVIADGGHERYRVLTAPDHPDSGFYRRQVTVMAAVLRGEADRDAVGTVPADGNQAGPVAPAVSWTIATLTALCRGSMCSCPTRCFARRGDNLNGHEATLDRCIVCVGETVP